MENIQNYKLNSFINTRAEAKAALKNINKLDDLQNNFGIHSSLGEDKLSKIASAINLITIIGRINSIYTTIDNQPIRNQIIECLQSHEIGVTLIQANKLFDLCLHTGYFKKGGWFNTSYRTGSANIIYQLIKYYLINKKSIISLEDINNKIKNDNLDIIRILTPLEHFLTNWKNSSNDLNQRLARHMCILKINDCIIANATILDLSNLGLTEIPPFHTLPKMSNIKQLNLSNNQITEISYINTFSGLNNLKELDLSNNKISKIKEHTLDELVVNLKKLNLKNNQLNIIGNLVVLNNLEEIDLKGNSIRIEKSAYNWVEKLKEFIW